VGIDAVADAFGLDAERMLLAIGRERHDNEM
jgi:hypothetical protein